jgi:NAD(P)H-hydrate epimerase
MLLYSGSQVRELDRQVISDYGVPDLVLMEAAALGAARVLADRYRLASLGRAVIVCGRGNNGGDGAALSRHLVQAGCRDVVICLADGDGRLSPSMRTNLDIAVAYGIPVRQDVPGEVNGAGLVVDAILGTGVTGNPRDACAAAISAINGACGGKNVVALDVPSGLDSDSGACGDPTVHASLTVTIGVDKPDYAGDVALAPLAYPRALLESQVPAAMLTDPRAVQRWFPGRKQGTDVNKGKFGSVAIFAGALGYSGAACLAALGAARSGAGLVTLFVPDSVYTSVSSRVPENIMVRSLPSNGDGGFSQKAAQQALCECGKMSCAVIGCGVGQSADTAAFVWDIVANLHKPLVIDADGLNLVSAGGDKVRSAVLARESPTVLTPHPGEMARLLHSDTASVQRNRLAAVTTAVTDFRCVTVLKGAGTLISAPDRPVAINTTGNPGMAAGGSGDLLAGTTAAFMARNVGPAWEAAVASCYVHGLAGDIAAQRLGGKTGLMAPDIAECLPQAISQCENYDS